MRSALL